MTVQIDDFVPFLLFAIPIVAMCGAFVAKITRMLVYQRMVELARRERLAALERGIDPERLRALDGEAGATGEPWMAQVARRQLEAEDRDRAHRLLTAGLVWLAAGAALAVMLLLVDAGDRAWAAGILPAAVGLAMLASAAVVSADLRPRA